MAGRSAATAKWAPTTPTATTHVREFSLRSSFVSALPLFWAISAGRVVRPGGGTTWQGFNTRAAGVGEGREGHTPEPHEKTKRRARGRAPQERTEGTRTAKQWDARHPRQHGWTRRRAVLRGATQLTSAGLRTQQVTRSTSEKLVRLGTCAHKERRKSSHPQFHSNTRYTTNKGRARTHTRNARGGTRTRESSSFLPPDIAVRDDLNTARRNHTHIYTAV